MAARANWKGFLKLGELSCPVALYSAASQSERIAFHTLNRATGNRVHRQFVDSETGKPVEHDEQVKGYETAQDEYIVLEPDEIAAAVPESDKTLTIEQFVACDDIDDVYFDRPYYLAPSDPVAVHAFTLIRDGMSKAGVAALARTVLFRRVRTVLVRPHDTGLIATTLNFDYEVRSADEAFEGLAKRKIAGEMLDLAKHIIKTKHGMFDPSRFDDRYEAALAALVKAKLDGKPLPKPKAQKPGKVVDLMEALRQSAGTAPKTKTKAKRRHGTEDQNQSQKGRGTAAQGGLTDRSVDLSQEAQFQHDAQARGRRRLPAAWSDVADGLSGPAEAAVPRPGRNR